VIEAAAGWLVQQPAHIALVALLNLAVWAICRATVLHSVPKSKALWVPGVLWLAYAAWEGLLLWLSPGANIRVDLLLIWPAIAIVTLWAALRALRGWWSSMSRERS
jgi:hypothetical protein